LLLTREATSVPHTKFIKSFYVSPRAVAEIEAMSGGEWNASNVVSIMAERYGELMRRSKPKWLTPSVLKLLMALLPPKLDQMWAIDAVSRAAAAEVGARRLGAEGRGVAGKLNRASFLEKLAVITAVEKERAKLAKGAGDG
jgi:hypothetical protein